MAKNPVELANQMVKPRKNGDTFSFNGQGAWSGAVNALDGTIEETHPYKRAKENDFHHSFYFSDPMIEKIANGDNLFFYVDNKNNIHVNPTGRADKPYDENFIIESIKKQIGIK